jgi:flagellar biosynthesis/type III secretory pathway chaperone
MKISNKVLYTIIVVLTIIICLLLNSYKNKVNENDAIKNMYHAANSEVTKIVNSNGELETKIEIITTKNVKLLADLESNDKTIIKLKKEVDYYKKKLYDNSSVSIISSQTNISNNEPTIIYVPDTNIIDLSNFTPIMPTYITNISKYGEWITGKIVANQDSIAYNINIKNELSVVLGEEKQGFLKPRIPVAIVKDENPYTDIKDMKVYKVEKNYKSQFRTFMQGSIFGFLVGFFIN